jgi:hypothetical protein
VLIHVAIGLILAGFQGAGSRTVWDGVYTAEQATRGQAAFVAKCASCHGANLEGTHGSAVEVDATPLTGSSFIDKWREDDLGELFRYIRDGMPREAAGTVSDMDKVDILAFILDRNSFPAGSQELTPNALRNIMLVGKEGSRPLPSMTPVRAVGCLSKVPSGWTLTRASEPVRTRTAESTVPEELKLAGSMPLGTLTFKLPGLDFAIPGLKPTSLVGHKVHVKGVVYRQPNNERINVMAISSLAESCGP